MDALTFLRQDHKSVLGMLEVLEDAPSGSGAQLSGLDTMVTNLVIAESQQEAIEEQYTSGRRFAHRSTRGMPPLTKRSRRSRTELLQLLNDGQPGEPEFHQALKDFVKLGREHIAYEQDVVFPRFAAAASSEELDKLGG